MTIIVNDDKPTEATTATTATTLDDKKEEEEEPIITNPNDIKEEEVINAASIEAKIIKPKVGMRVAKTFTFFGDITEVWKDKKGEDNYSVLYEDDDREDFSRAEAQAGIVLAEEEKDLDITRRSKTPSTKRGGKAPSTYRRVSPYPKRN